MTTPPNEVSDLKSQSGTTPSNQTAVAAKTRKQAQQNQPFFSDAPVTAEKLEFEILKAIYNRAIRGVEASVRDGTVFLTGKLGTGKQKPSRAAAARAGAGR